ncbi:MAG TPA: SpoIIE family protein phosphatase [Candidatus Cybelea sp.]|jgi:serine phosphatase RsbU (regulator of sigma subunit)|nr:SpoIIE family protein phosphatase [Candidatus Cybelea sp.]
MSRQRHIALIVTMVLAAVVIISLGVAGLLVHQVVASSFAETTEVRRVRVEVDSVLREQLDEETGIRGYAVSFVPALLQPYRDAARAFPASVLRLGSDLTFVRSPDAMTALADISRTNRRWQVAVAQPVLQRQSLSPALQLDGKRLVDGIRADVRRIDRDLAVRRAAVERRSITAVAWIAFLGVFGVVALVAVAIVFSVQQYRLAERAERSRREAEAAQLQSAALQAAYDAERRVTDTLQQAFVQRPVPAIANLSFSAVYLPAEDEERVGGDWYDVIKLPGDRALLIIGDVAGHGIDAAVAMSKARHALIFSGIVNLDPASLLRHANVELTNANSPLITALAVVLDSSNGTLQYASAGHPPPLLVEPGKPARLLEFGSFPLGVGTDSEYRSHRLQVARGSSLILYTDGVIEHSHDTVAGELLLKEAAQAAIANSEENIAAAIRDRIFGPNRRRDDVAILSVRLTRGSERSGRIRSLEEMRRHAAMWPARVGRRSRGDRDGRAA